MRRALLAMALLAGVAALVARWPAAADMPLAVPALAVPPEIVADYLHDIIEADRTAYTVHVVERMQVMGVVMASENWRERPTLPLPAQLLLEASRAVSAKPNAPRYRLMSLWPINPKNGPSNDFEKRGLEVVGSAPERPYTGMRDRAGGRYFEAIYADRAVSQACVTCHNSHEKSPRHDLKRGEVMGGIIISIPIPPP